MLYVAAPHKLKIAQLGTTKAPGNFPNVQTCAIDRHFYYYRIMASRMQPIQPTLRADIPSSTTVSSLLVDLQTDSACQASWFRLH